MGLEVLEKELRFFDQIKPDLMKAHKGKIALIKDEHLVDTFTTLEEAYKEGITRFGKEPFLIKPVHEIEEQQRIPALTVNLLHANL